MQYFGWIKMVSLWTLWIDSIQLKMVAKYKFAFTARSQFDQGQPMESE
jgi:hypothetical protein